MLSNYDIEDICDYYQIPLKSITMKDKLLKSKISKNGNYIINLQSEKEKGGGTHWTCSMTRGDQAMYFDSFGAPEPLEVSIYLKSFGYKKVGYNNWIIQNIKSEMCGFFCIALFYHIKIHLEEFNNDLIKCSNDYCNLFYDDSTRNDQVLINYFLSMSNNLSPVVRNIFKKYTNK